VSRTSVASSGWGQLGGNPCPGNPGRLREHAQGLSAVATGGEDVDRRLTEYRAGMFSLRWTGEGSEAVKERLTSAAPQLAQLVSSHRTASRALESYAADLEHFQLRAQSLLTAADRAIVGRTAAGDARATAAQHEQRASAALARATDEVRTLQTRRMSVECTVDPVALHQLDSELVKANQRRNQAKTDLDCARNEVDAANRASAAADDDLKGAVREAERLRDDCRERADATARAILDAGGLSIGVFAAVKQSFTDFVRDTRAFIVSDEFDHLLDTLEDIGNVVGTVLLVTGVVLTLTNPLGWAALGTVLAGVSTVGGFAALGLAGGVFVGRTLRAANGADDWRAVGAAGLDLGLVAAGPALSRFSSVARAQPWSKGKGLFLYDDLAGSLKRVVPPDAPGRLPQVLSKVHPEVQPPLDRIPASLRSGFETFNAVRNVVGGGKDVFEVADSGADGAPAMAGSATGPVPPVPSLCTTVSFLLQAPSLPVLGPPSLFGPVVR
jgi:hypothetical protein